MVLKSLLLLPFFAIYAQMYLYAVSRKGVERQVACRTLGITTFSFGIVALIYRSPVFVFTGMIMMMCGLRLIAHGLDRIEKKIYIDRYQQPEADRSATPSRKIPAERPTEANLSAADATGAGEAEFP